MLATILIAGLIAGYVNPSRTPCINEAPVDSNNLPTTPPPTYEYVLEEVGVYFLIDLRTSMAQWLIYWFGLLQNTRLSQHQRQLSSENSATPNQNSRRSSANSSRQSAAHLSAALELQLNLNDRRNSNSQSISDSDIDSSDICNDPDCQQNYTNSNSCGSRSNNNNHSNINNNEGEQQQQQGHSQRIIEGVTELQLHSDHEESTLSVNEFLLETEMAAARAKEHNLEGQQLQPCTDEQCTQCGEQAASEEDGEEPSTSNAARQNFYDPLLNRYGNEGESRSH